MVPANLIPKAKIVSYADDSYVILTGDDINALKMDVEACLQKHTEYLLSLGMIVNEKKTELVLFNKGNLPNIEINVTGNKITSMDNMKILGVIFNKNLDWKPQVDRVIAQATRLSHGLKFLRKRLSQKQFIKATTSQFFGLVYYGSTTWLGAHLKKSSSRD